MSKYTVIYWSMTGNTASMAEAIEAALAARGHEVSLYEVSDANVDQALEADVLVLGCPAMGDEVLDESEFQPFFDSLVPSLSGRKLALFGAYGWGEGQWMRDWEEAARAAGAQLLSDGFIRNDDFSDGIETWVENIG